MSAELYLAHPMIQPGGLPFPPAVLATAAVLLLVAGTRLGAPRRVVAGGEGSAHSRSLDQARGAAPPLWWATRLLGVVLLVVVVASGRLRNAPLGPALVLQVAWPLLLLASALTGQVWRWLDPFDTLARLVERHAPAAEQAPAERVVAAPEPAAVGAAVGVGGGGSHVPGAPSDVVPAQAAAAAGPPAAVWGAVVPALAWAYYSFVYLDALQPRSVAVALAAYTLLMLAGAAVVGRQRWLRRTEVFGLAFSWAGLLRGHRLAFWRAPAGAEVVLGVLLGGMLFAILRGSTLWATLPYTAWYPWYAALGLLTCAGLAVWLVRACERWAGRLGAAGAVTAAVVPLLVAVAVATSLAGHRMLIALQSLPRLLGDPFNLGWDPIGAATWVVRPNLLGAQGLIWLQLAVLLVGAVVGTRVASGRAPSRRAAEPATVAAGLLLAVAVAGVTAV